MITKEIREAAVEINSIFENMSLNLLNKIPLNFKLYLKNIESKNYKFEYDKTKKLNEQKLLPTTKSLIALIYRDYLCNDIERYNFNKKYNKILMQIEEEKKEKFETNEIFKTRPIDKNFSNEEKLPIKYKKNSFFKQIIKKLTNIFKKYNNKK